MKSKPIFVDAPLPDNCPPSGAGHTSKTVFLRLVGPGKKTKADITEEDFASHAALGKQCSSARQLCSFKACSLLLRTISREAILGLVKLPNLRSKNAVAFTLIDESSGVIDVDSKTHANLWMYVGANLPAGVTNVVKIDDYKPPK